MSVALYQGIYSQAQAPQPQGTVKQVDFGSKYDVEVIQLYLIFYKELS